MEPLFNELCFAIQEFHKQGQASHTIHQILFSLKTWMPLQQAMLVIKDNDTDYLEIHNRYNISEQCAKQYHRGIGKKLVARIFYTDEIITVTASGNRDDYEDLKVEEDYASAVAVRVALDNYPVGFMALYFNAPFELTHAARDFLTAIAKIVAEALRKERLMMSVLELRRTDASTGLFSSEYFHQKFQEEYLKSNRYQNDLSLAIMDLDNYKEVLSTYGETIAEKLFKETAGELKQCIRNIDVLGRRGRDECIIYLPNTSLVNARKVLNRFREQMGHKTFTEKNLNTSVTIGLSAYAKGYSLEDIINKAQVAFYHARLSGQGIVTAET